jgi:hypothetical protein
MSEQVAFSVIYAAWILTTVGACAFAYRLGKIKGRIEEIRKINAITQIAAVAAAAEVERRTRGPKI